MKNGWKKWMFLFVLLSVFLGTNAKLVEGEVATTVGYD